MALLTETEVRAAGSSARQRVYKTAAAVLNESLETARTSFDIFLSHSRLDGEIVLGVKTVLEGLGQTVYVDWVDDPHLDRRNVTPATAHKLRIRMRQSKSLFYVHSGNASTSRWMPWELGYFDGFNGSVAILPLVQSSLQTTYKGEEYLGLYPYVDVTGGTIYIHRNPQEYAKVSTWREAADKLRPAA